jgi:hypothetical protein
VVRGLGGNRKGVLYCNARMPMVGGSTDQRSINVRRLSIMSLSPTLFLTTFSSRLAACNCSKIREGVTNSEQLHTTTNTSRAKNVNVGIDVPCPSSCPATRAADQSTLWNLDARSQEHSTHDERHRSCPLPLKLLSPRAVWPVPCTDPAF